MTRMRFLLIVGGSALLFAVVGPFLYSAASGLGNPVGDCSPVGSQSPVGSESPVFHRHGHHGAVGGFSPVGSNSPVGSCSPLGNLAPTKVSIDVSGGGQYGRFVNVDPDDLVNAQATLSGPDAATASGTVTYEVFSLTAHHWDWNQVAPSDTVTVTDGVVPGSAQITLGPGVYTWIASYSGDSVNAASRSAAHADIEFVLPADCQAGVGWLSMR
ncbi:MAG TPA: Ig-like domain-containing protein, partial [Acidimicrobiales bacterium]|nr:Ig-like domain-containing protein [Acidimicrobiales bacterium]